MTTPPKIDGIIDSTEWANVPTGKGGFDSQDGHPAPEPMQFWLAYDESYIYFAARLGDHDPKSIHAQQYQTNVDLSGDDNVQLQLDLNGSLADFNTFGINSRGATSLALAGGRADKREWSGEFVARGRVTDTGWEVEAQIPWQMMRLPRAGVRNLRFNVARYLPRDKRSYAFAYTQSGHQAETPMWQSVTIPKQQQPRILKLLPYIYAGYDARIGAVFNSGLDMKTELTDKITLVGTVNPDFRNIEDQILSLDFSRFERLANETRPFFAEGSQFMNSALYASQRIASVDAGVNAYGRLNDRTSFGVIDTARFGHEYDFVGNVSFDPNPNDSYRLSLSNLMQPGLQSSAYLARYSRQVGPVSLFFRSMGSLDTEQGDGQYETMSAFYLKKEWNASLEYDWASPRFEARLGYLPEIDYRGLSYNLGYDKVYAHGRVAEAGIGYSGAELTHIDGVQYRRHNEVDSMLALRNRTLLTLNYYTERFNGQDDHLMQAAVTYPRDDVFRNLSLELDQGSLALVHYTSVSATANYRFGRRLQTSVRYQRVHHGDHQDQLILTGSYDLLHDRSLSGRIVKSNSDINGYVSLRQSGNRGVEYFLIVGDPNATRFRASVIVKVVCPFDLLLSRAPQGHGR
ncbi:MAG TPA: DUF5916 domain-containing protein [Chthonomonadaceae bacterium]|nr:DUF5916 domain-containing protein [Chthonomonadaceae bacterium]